MIAAYEAPDDLVRGEIFNLLHSNYQIRELAMLVAGSVQLAGRPISLTEVEAPALLRDYECANAKLSQTLGFIPRRSVLEAVSELLGRIDVGNHAYLTDPRHYTIRWLELLTELKPALRSVRDRPVTALLTGGGGQLASDLQSLLGSEAVSVTRAQVDISDPEALHQAVAEAAPDVIFNSGAFHNLDQCEADPARAFAVNVEAVRNLCRYEARLVHMSTNYVFDGSRAEPYAEDDLPAPRSIYAISKLAGEYAALAYGQGALVVRTAGLYGLHGSASKGGNFVQRMLGRARDTGKLTVVADQRLQPTYTADLAQSLIDAVHRGADGVLHLTASRACSWHEFTQAIVELAGLDVPVEPAVTSIGSGVDRPLNGVLARPRADALGLDALPDWRDGLERYMAQAGLRAA
jgi:dTDP-4-dehydrorhamnose reductase